MEHGLAPDWAVALEASGLGEAMRHSTWLYPAANLLHLLGLVLLAGSMVVLDLRLLGVAAAVPLAALSRFLTPVAAGGLALLLGSGFALFAADAGPLAGNTLLRIKWALIALGIANALLFRWMWTERLAGWDDRAPLAGRVQAALSLAIWFAVAAAGRLIAYY
ncbi:MAG TPA: DUF6644 family protein [Azospirillum sp.]|nr:DUF6644 family protein [Azospirillum sp.]